MTLPCLIYGSAYDHTLMSLLPFTQQETQIPREQWLKWGCPTCPRKDLALSPGKQSSTTQVKPCLAAPFTPGSLLLEELQKH